MAVRSIRDALISGITGAINAGIGTITGSNSSEAVSPVGPSAPTEDDTTGSSYSGYSYGYGSYGSGAGSAGPTENQKEAGKNLGAIVGGNADTLRDYYDDMMSVYDTADEMNLNLLNKQQADSKAQLGSDWFRQHMKLQRVTSALNDRSGNALNGSYLADYRDLIAAADDNIDSETLDTMRENANNLNNSYFETLAQNINNRNEAALDTEQGLRELYSDYLAQLNNIHPDLVKDYLDTEGHNVKPMDWLQTDFFDSHKREAATPETQGLYRPDRANETAREQGLTGGRYATASAANGEYWNRVNAGYDQRPRQA